MRRTLELLGWIALAVNGWVTYWAVWGPNPLPERIPIHFDLAGNPNGWGSPKGIFILPAVALGLYLLMGLVARYPAAFNYPVKVRPEFRARAEELALDMIAWLRAELACLFCTLQLAVIQAARTGRAPEIAWVMPVYLLVVLGTIAGFMVAMTQLGKRRE